MSECEDMDFYQAKSYKYKGLFDIAHIFFFQLPPLIIFSLLFQVIAFLYAAMRSVDIGLKAAMIVTPVNVLHNWRHEFTKWRPTEFKPIRVYMLEDVPRFYFYSYTLSCV